MEIDESLLELYRSEVDTHMATLNDRLLALERDPAAGGGCAELMRAAHSIKGAARIVGLQPAVDLAHGIEDCFVGVGAARIALTSDLVDVLLEGVDLLQQVTLVQPMDVPDTTEPAARVAEFLDRLTRRIAGEVVQPRQPVESSRAIPAPSGASPHRISSWTLSAGRSLDADWVAAHRATFVDWQAAAGTLQLNLSAVERIDATGALLLASLDETSRHRDESARVQWIEPTPRVQRFLELAGLTAASRPTETGD